MVARKRRGNCTAETGSGWNAGVVGIVCSRMVERFNKPCIIIAKEGDTVEIINGDVYINGKLLEEDYVKKQNSTFATGDSTKWTLGENEVFYLGDNRMFSKDSWRYGRLVV